MSTYILTSMFPNGLNDKNTELFQNLITKRHKFAFVASEFEMMHEKTDNSAFDIVIGTSCTVIIVLFVIRALKAVLYNFMQKEEFIADSSFYISTYILI